MEKVSLILSVIVAWNCSDTPQQKSLTWQHITPCNLLVTDQKNTESSNLLFVDPALNRIGFKLRYQEHGVSQSL